MLTTYTTRAVEGEIDGYDDMTDLEQLVLDCIGDHDAGRYDSDPATSGAACTAEFIAEMTELEPESVAILLSLLIEKGALMRCDDNGHGTQDFTYAE